MSCSVGEVTERLKNELCYEYNYELCSFSNISFTSPTSQLIHQPFHRFIYVTAHSQTLPLLYLRHSSFPNPSFASPTSQALPLIHLASRPWKEPLWRASILGIYRIPNSCPDVIPFCNDGHCSIWNGVKNKCLMFQVQPMCSSMLTRGCSPVSKNINGAWGIHC